MKTQSQRLIFNALSVFAKTLALTAIGIILTPFVVGQVGRASYGLIVIIASFFGFLQMVQIGTPQALIRFMPQELEHGDRNRLSCLMSTGFAMLCIAGVLVAVGTVLTVLHPSWIASMAVGVSAKTLRFLIIILGASAALDLPLSFGNFIFQAHERYVKHSILQTSGYLLRFILVLMLLTVFPGNILAYALGTVGGNLLGSLGILIAALLLFRETQLRVRAIDLRIMVKIGSFGLLTVVNTLAMMMFVQADYIVIGKMIGNEEVTVFNLGVVWVITIRSYVSAAMSVVTPSASRTVAEGKPEILREMLLRTTKYGLLASLLPLVFLIPFRNVLMNVWMGRGYDASALILLFVLVGDIFANGVSGGISMLIGTGRLRFLTTANLIAGVLNISIGIFLLKVFNLGIMSFAYAYCAVFVVLNSIVLPVYLSRAFKLPLKEYFLKSWRGPILVGLFSLPIAFLIRQIMLPKGWISIFICGSMFLIAYSAIVFCTATDEFDRRSLRQLLKGPSYRSQEG